MKVVPVWHYLNAECVKNVSGSHHADLFPFRSRKDFEVSLIIPVFPVLRISSCHGLLNCKIKVNL